VARRLPPERLGLLMFDPEPLVRLVVAERLPEERLEVIIDGAGDDPRRISIRAGTAGYARYLELAASIGADEEAAG